MSILGISAAAWKKDSAWAKFYLRCPECRLLPHVPTDTESVYDDLFYLEKMKAQWKMEQASKQALVATANRLPQLEPGPRRPPGGNYRCGIPSRWFSTKTWSRKSKAVSNNTFNSNILTKEVTMCTAVLKILLLKRSLPKFYNNNA